MSETVNHPSHYGGDTEYETIKVLRAWLSPEEFRGFLRGNAIKYQSRLGKKGERSEDAAKSAWYAEELRKFEVDLEEAMIAAANPSEFETAVFIMKRMMGLK